MSFEQTPLNEFITLQRGFDLPKGDRAEGAVPVIASTGVGGYHNTAKVEAPGVVIGRSGSIGGGQYIQEPFWPLNTTLWVKDFKGHDPRYIYYLMRSIDFTKFNVGSGVPTLNRNHLSSLLVNEIGIDREKTIAKLLGDLDDKIALNTQTNQTLEQMAQAIFKSWFVDFDPVKAKMNGEQPEGMDAATASLFPEKLVESELGLIPEGWEVGTLDSHTSMIIDHRGKTPKKLGSDWVEEGYPAISAKNIKSKKIVRPDTIRFIDEATYKKWMKEPLIKGDIIMTSEAPMGELYFFDGSEDFCLSQRLYGLRANSDVCSPEFLFNWLQTTKAKADMEGRASGTTALGIKQAELRKVKILTPPLELLEKYSAVASNLVDMAAKNNAQNTVLEDLRDTLLPKLLSGEIELGQAQELAEVE
ncbi:restriction endonuclease subunit S [Vibrio alginolyticus]|nr:restriction endonuclease subunit S [Vibrio alginolyticus]